MAVDSRLLEVSSWSEAIGSRAIARASKHRRCVLIAQRLVEPTSFPKQLSRFVQELYGMDFLEESDVVSQVGEERIFRKFRMLNLLPAVKRPKPVECFCACAGSIDAETMLANESTGFGEKVRGGFVECAAAAATCREVDIVAPHVTRVQKPLCKNI